MTRAPRRHLWAATLIVALVLPAACSSGDGQGGDTAAGPTSGAAPEFGTESLTVSADGGAKVRGICLLVADTDELRRVGLSGRESLDGYDGMLFVFPTVESHRFWMKDTHIPLDLVPVDTQGEIIEVIPMEPCEGGDCPTYGPDDPYDVAVELPQGDMESWGFDPDAGAVRVDRSGAPCEASDGSG